jgi:NAD(P)-dependent dehydrogenase (short-subunit alcohol dehydrogenase family)
VSRTCVVTGGASGIGRATLELFCANGYSCVGIDRDRDAIGRALDDLDLAARGQLRFEHADLLDPEVDLTAIGELTDAEADLTLVNNLGGSPPRGRGPLGPDDWEEFAEVLAFNLRPLHLLTHACLGAMRDRGYGRIVNVASVSGRRPLGAVDAAYAAAKAAVIAVSRQLAVELAQDGILVNTVCPGVIATGRIEERWAKRPEEVNRAVLAEIPLGRLGTPEEVAQAIYFLGSTSTYATGCLLDVNGGMYVP